MLTFVFSQFNTPSPLLLYPHIWQVTLPSVLTLLPLLLLLLLLLFSLVLVFFWVFSAMIQQLPARCEQYEGWLTTVLVQNCQADLTSHTKLFSFLEIVYQSRWVVLSLSWLWILLLWVLIPFHLLPLSSKDILVHLAQLCQCVPLLCSFVHYSNIWPIVHQQLVSCPKLSSFLYSAFGMAWWSKHLSVHSNHTFCQAPGTPLEPRSATSYILSGQASYIYWQYDMLFQ